MLGGQAQFIIKPMNKAGAKHRFLRITHSLSTLMGEEKNTILELSERIE